MNQTPTPTSRGCARVREFIHRHWHPKPIQPPTVDPDLKYLNAAQRSAEVVRYSVLSWEFWLSPNGQLREWFRLNGKVGTWLLIPALLVLPIITFILWQLAKWVSWLVSIAGNLIVFPLAAFAAAGITIGAIILLRIILGK